MKNYQKDTLIRSVYVILTILYIACFAYILSFFLSHSLNKTQINVPVLDSDTLKFVETKIDNRQDVDTNGKPNIAKFNFGNQEPF